jgi:hypothetical protein
MCHPVHPFQAIFRDIHHTHCSTFVSQFIAKIQHISRNEAEKIPCLMLLK